MDDLRKKFGKWLQTLRRQAGLTQEQLAEATEISVDFVSLVERGINAPSFDNLEKLAKARGVTIRVLFDYELL
jgi:transcriptional regulator with XRE-family HTH domain